MDGSIRLSASERKELLSAYRSGEDVKMARRAHIVLLASEGWSQRELRAITFASFDLINECLRRFREGGVATVLERAQPKPSMPRWLLKVAQWLTTRQPQDFGYFRSRWSCELLANTLAWESGERRSTETVRRGLRRLGFVWRRPRPTLALQDPDYAERVERIRTLLHSLASDETALFQDEVDVQLNPKIGSCWMRRGQQAKVVTPGNNQKRHVAGSLHWRTGTLLVSEPSTRRNSELFIRHLDYLRRKLRSFRLIHVVCDNAAFHRSLAVQRYLSRWRHRLRLHFLPRYAPETNPIERVWWHFHETITRNHRCGSLDELLQQAYRWFDHQRGFFHEMRNTYQVAA